jgi:26S proteasome regulatory subunit T6
VRFLCQVHPEGKYVVDIDDSIDINKCTPGVRVALRNDSYSLHLLLPSKVRACPPLSARFIWRWVEPRQ